MGYQKVFNKPYEEGYKNLPDKTTPVTAEILNMQDDTFESVEDYLENLTYGMPTDSFIELLQDYVPQVNPATTGDEPLLTGLSVGEAVYRIPGGSAENTEYTPNSIVKSDNVQDAIDELVGMKKQEVYPIKIDTIRNSGTNANIIVSVESKGISEDCKVSDFTADTKRVVDGIFVKLNSNKWEIYAEKKCYYNGNTFEKGSLIETWAYSLVKHYIIETEEGEQLPIVAFREQVETTHITTERTIEDASDGNIVSLSLVGNTTQGANPSPSNPQPINGFDGEMGTHDDNGNESTIHTFPLYSIGDVKDELKVFADGSGELIKRVKDITEEDYTHSIYTEADYFVLPTPTTRALTPSEVSEILKLKTYRGKTYVDAENVDFNLEYFADSEIGKSLADVNSKVEEISEFRIFVGSTNNAGFHNSIFRGKDITSYLNDKTLFTRISDGTFSDLFVGDYFRCAYAGATKTFRIAGFDVYLRNGDTPLTTHHAVIVPDESLTTSYMNSTNTTEGGYKGSYMHNTTIPSIVNNLKATAFGNNLVAIRELITNTVNNDAVSGGYSGWKGASSNWEWSQETAMLMSEIEVYGSRVFGSSGYDIGNAKTQLPLFKLAPEFINPSSYWYWLKDVADATRFCNSGGNGEAGSHTASNVTYIRPRFIID